MWSSDRESIFLNQNLSMILKVYINTDDVQSVCNSEDSEGECEANSMSFQTPFTCELEY